MTVTVLVVILSFSAILLIYYGYVEILDAPLIAHENNILRDLTVQELGRIEGGILNLKEVIVIADKIEEPTDELYWSVKENLHKQVRYIFLISKGNYHNEKSKYLNFFQKIDNTEKDSYKVDIYPLNFDWDDYPYIFYRFIEQETKSQKAFAYMGTQLREGIADKYELINPTIAKKMLDLAFGGVTIPEYEKISDNELYDVTPKIIRSPKAA